MKRSKWLRSAVSPAVEALRSVEAEFAPGPDCEAGEGEANSWRNLNPN